VLVWDVSDEMMGVAVDLPWEGVFALVWVVDGDWLFTTCGKDMFEWWQERHSRCLRD